jgi:type III secretion system YscQ/HrcQ family protein
MRQEVVTAQRLRRLDPALVGLDHIPLNGGAPPFPIEAMSEKLGELFELKSAKLKLDIPTWLTSDELLGGVGQETYLVTLLCSPIPTPLFLAIARADLVKMMMQLFSGEQETAAQFESSMREAFAHFIILQLLRLLDEMGYPDEGFSFRLAPPASLPDEAALSIDLSLTLSRRKISSRLLIPEKFYQEWCRRLAKRTPSRLPEQLIRELDLVLHLELAETHLSYAEWSQTGVGDFISLNTVDPEKIRITLEGETLFGGRMSPDGVVIEPLPPTHEVSEQMEDDQENNEALSTEDEEEWEEEEATTAPANGMLSPDKIPLKLTVEIGQVATTAERLLAMQAGNVIELKRSLEQGVDLVVNGKRVGKGELMQIGDQIGVRVVEVG